eukprot:CAMPEP_0178920968 /NCGR_PEP_ID=MMETSP0786-20121207/15295_1 /TAXON_ID=186022 /ORGANISM="Thalassionema frauenfeldii, Strain CCMP 1798" /LENGTH=153 /DNA_ID=CAMNT_0020595085 /DNA_START=209 /DNA_END=670 /DNA_ORIENTATION=-
MMDLQRRIEKQQNQYYDLFLSEKDGDSKPRPENVHIIVFNPDTDDQEVHTIEFPKGSGLNVILAFESQKECINFAEMLQQDNLLPDPVPSEAPLLALEEFCEQMGVPVKVVPDGTDLRPPTDNVDNFGTDEKSEEDNMEEEEEEHQDGIESWQ